MDFTSLTKLSSAAVTQRAVLKKTYLPFLCRCGCNVDQQRDQISLPRLSHWDKSFPNRNLNRSLSSSMTLSNRTSGEAGKREGSRRAGTGTDTAPAYTLAGWFIMI